MIRTFITIALVLSAAATWLSQDFAKVDEFAKQTNDALSTRVNFFVEKLSESKTDGFIVVKGPQWSKYHFIRKIEGCNRWWNRPVDAFKFVLGSEQEELRVEFWSVQKGQIPTGLFPTVLDYRLSGLREAVELTSSQYTQEYCPVHFDVDWYSKFMVANPTFRGRVVIDTSQKDFVRRVTNHRQRLLALGVSPKRVRFMRRHFYHETDEQWWIIPSK